MKTLRTKKSPTPSTAKKTGAEPRAALPEGRPSRVYSPSKTAKAAKTAGKSVLGKLAAFGGEARLEERVVVLEMVVTRLALSVADLLGDIGGDLRRRWEENHIFELTAPLNEETREAAFEAWNAEGFARADEKRAGR